MLSGLSLLTLTNQEFKMPQSNNITSILRCLSISLSVTLITVLNPVFGQSAPPAQHTERSTSPTDPHTPGYVTAKELPDSSNPPANVDGNFIIGPTHNAAPEMSAQTNVPKGDVIEFTMNSSDSRIYPGIARDANTFGTVHAEGDRLCPQAVRAR